MEFQIDRDKMSNSDDNSAPEFGDKMNKRELNEAIEEYAEWFVSNNSALSEVDLGQVTFKISTKSKRSAGLAGHRGNIDDLHLKMAWKAYQKWGWNEDWVDTIEHELIHIWQFQVHGEGNHGRTFKRKAREIDAPRHCPQFTEYKYQFFCSKCGGESSGRYKNCKAVKSIRNNENRYKSKCCGEQLRVEKN